MNNNTPVYAIVHLKDDKGHYQERPSKSFPPRKEHVDEHRGFRV